MLALWVLFQNIALRTQYSVFSRAAARLIAISFLNDNSPFKHLTKSHQNIQICVGAADEPETAVVIDKYETASQTVFAHCIVISVLQRKCHKTGIKVYNSNTNTEVFGSNQNREFNHSFRRFVQNNSDSSSNENKWSLSNRYFKTIHSDSLNRLSRQQQLTFCQNL